MAKMLPLLLMIGSCALAAARPMAPMAVAAATPSPKAMVIWLTYGRGCRWDLLGSSTVTRAPSARHPQAISHPELWHVPSSRSFRCMSVQSCTPGRRFSSPCRPTCLTDRAPPPSCLLAAGAVLSEDLQRLLLHLKRQKRLHLLRQPFLRVSSQLPLARGRNV